MTRKQRRLVLIGTAFGVLALSAGLVLSALDQSITFFNTPADVIANKVPPGQRIRLGGLVQPGTVERGGTTVTFSVIDGTATTLRVAYTGILPDLFREGQGVVTEGALLPDGTFKADTVLAKHDETYMPPELADALKKQGHWKTGATADNAPMPGAAPAKAY